MGYLRSLIRNSCYFLYVVGAMAGYFLFSSSLHQNKLELQFLYLIIATPIIGLIWLQEKYQPFRTDWQTSQDDEWSDLLQTLILFPLIIEVTLFLQKKILMGFALPWIHNAHPVVQLLVILLIAEWGYYWYHRISHRKKELWKLHAVHHGAHRVYWMNSARFHVLDMILASVIYFLPLSLFNVSMEVIIGFILINSVTGLLEHANIDFKAGRLNYFFNTAELHRWHHSNIGKECQTNFGKVLSVWDLVHGSFYLPKNKFVASVGVGKQRPVPNDFKGQLNYPFAKPVNELLHPRNTYMKVAIGGALLLISSLAIARDFQPISSCYSIGKAGSLLLKYNPIARYSRDVDALVTPLNCSAGQVARILSGVDLLPWYDIEKFQSLLDNRPGLKAAVESIAKGSNVVIPASYSARDYLREHPISNYTRSLNIELTQKFGHGFSGQIYREYLLNNPANQKALSEIATNIRTYRSLQVKAVAAAEIKKLSSNTVLLVSMGLDWSDEVNQHTPDYIKKFLTKIQQAGIEVKFMRRNPVGLMEDNVKEIQPQVEAVLASGKNVVLLGMCKGMPELLAAVSESMKGNLDAKRMQVNKKGRGKVEGVVGMSPMMGGLYWADKRDGNGAFDLIEELTGELPGRTTTMISTYLDALESITSEKTQSLLNRIAPNLPADVAYIGLSGILPNNARLYVKNSMKPFVDANRRLNIAKGANDGFLEYPKTAIPTSWSPRVFNVPVHGSHMLTDGAVNEYSLQNAENESALYYSLLKFILEKKKENVAFRK